jgi:hypothetical protein
VFIRNAPTFLDEARDPDGQRLDLDRLRRFDRPALLTKGSASPPFLDRDCRRDRAVVAAV